jgi:hypothetical protein
LWITFAGNSPRAEKLWKKAKIQTKTAKIEKAAKDAQEAEDAVAAKPASIATARAAK